MIQDKVMKHSPPVYLLKGGKMKSFIITALIGVFWTISPYRWEIEEVDKGHAEDRSASLTLDLEDRPHIVYNYGIKPNKLKYAFYDGSKWCIQVIDSIASENTGGKIRVGNIKLNHLGYPHICYAADTSHPPWGGNDFRYIYWDGSSWNIKHLDFYPHNSLLYGMLDLKNKNEPHIAYECNYFNELYKIKRVGYAYLEGEEWKSQVVDSAYGLFYLESFKISKSGNPHILYGDMESDDFWFIRYATQKGRSWDIQDFPFLVPVFTLGSHADLDLDSLEHPHIALCDRDSAGEDLWYGKWDGATWNFEKVDSGLCWYVSMQLDRKDYPHIVYFSDLITINYAWWNGNSWRIDTVVMKEGLKGLRGGLSMALDSKDRPHIVYDDDSIPGLMYARGLPEGLEEEKRRPFSNFLKVYPNLITKGSAIKIQISVETKANLKIYDAQGRLVKTLFKAKDLKHRTRSIEWDGRDNSSERVPSGVYFLRFEVEGYNATRKLLVTR